MLGKVRRDPKGNGYDLIDVSQFKFQKIDLSLQPPALYLYLTTRSAWMRFDKDVDVYVDMEGDGNILWPAGSFYEEGSYSMA